MNIAVFGLGYVGAVTAACLAHDGHDVVGVDPNPTKTRAIAAGRSPILEIGLDALVAASVDAGRLTVTDDPAVAVAASDVSLVCVGTPGRDSGSLDLRHVETVSREIGSALRDRAGFHVVAVRSTMIPGSTEAVVIPILEQSSGRVVGRDLGVCVNPEFLREGTAIVDYHHPAKTVVGESDPRAGDVVAALYADIDAPLYRTSLALAEMTKYTDNAWHAVKVVFGNEIGRIAKALGLDSHEVMDIFVQDDKANISERYLRPGFAFGGSCLPKDVAALTHRAKLLDVDVPMLSSILPSNTGQVEIAADMVLRRGDRRVGLLGLSFKPGTDDLRESPLVALAERLIGKGYELRIFEPSVDLDNLVGANREYILEHLPHIASLLVGSTEEVLSHAATVVVGYRSPDFERLGEILSPDQYVIDLARLDHTANLDSRYDGISW
jgi:GDP-mannose 6-dehydrogenase